MAMASHALHEPAPANVILISCHQAIALSLILTDISHSDTTLAFGILHNAVQEFWVSVNFGEPVSEDVNGLHECVNPASMITEYDGEQVSFTCSQLGQRGSMVLSQRIFPLAGDIPVTCLRA